MKDILKILKDKKVKALLVELGHEPKIYFTESDKEFPDAFGQAAASAALRIAKLTGDDPEEVGEALLAHMATKMHAILRKAEKSEKSKAHKKSKGSKASN